MPNSDKRDSSGCQACLTLRLTLIAERVRSDLDCNTLGEELTGDTSNQQPA
jgi:hypothetical protein